MGGGGGQALIRGSVIFTLVPVLSQQQGSAN